VAVRRIGADCMLSTERAQASEFEPELVRIAMLAEHDGWFLLR
jgi:hypothetical protein